MSTPFSGMPTPSDLDELLRRHEARQTLAARAAYCLLRMTAAVPPESRAAVGAADAGQQATAWLAGASTNPGRWTDRPLVVAELAEVEALLVDLRGHLETVLDWASAHLGAQAGRSGGQQAIRVPRTLLAECGTLIRDLGVLIPAAAA